MKFGKTGLLGLCLLGVAVLILAILTPSILSNKQDPVNQKTPVDTKPWPMSAKGVVESEQDVLIASLIEGQIAEVLVDEGDALQTGQLLVRFDNSKIEARIAAATAALRQTSARRAEIETGYRSEDIAAATHAVERAAAISNEARRTLDRQERLFSQGAVTGVTRDQANEASLVAQAELNQAQAQLDKMHKGPRAEEILAARAEEQQARAELSYLKTRLNDYQVTSPIDGVVVNRFRDSFEMVDVGTPILAIVNPDKLRLWAEVEETDAGLVKVGQSVSVTVDAFPGKEFHGKVTKVSAAVQRKSQRTFDPVATFDINTQKILVALDNYDGLVHGMSATVRFLQ
jgi:HlyD family secretion protein